MDKRKLAKLAEQARAAGVTGVSRDADGHLVVHMRAGKQAQEAVAMKLSDRHGEMIEAVLSGARTILEEHIVAIERGVAEVSGEEAASVAIKATWKSTKDEGMVLEVSGKASIPATKTTRSVQLIGGQLSLFGSELGTNEERASR